MTDGKAPLVHSAADQASDPRVLKAKRTDGSQNVPGCALLRNIPSDAHV